MNVQITLDQIIQFAEQNPSPQVFEDALLVLPNFFEDYPLGARAYSRHLRALAEEQVAVCSEPDDMERLIKAIENILRLNAATDFDSYMLFMEWNREPERQFYRPRRHVIYTLVQDLQDLADGKLDFLSISMPPRTGKSTMCIFFLTFVMGRQPLKANVMSGHSDKLTKGFHLEALSIITDETYRFAEVFPDAELKDKSMADETINLKKRNRFPSLTCRSIDGTLTGAVEVGKGALLYMDDLVSDREEALNSDRMEKLYQAYLNQLKDRMNDGARQLCVATRWVPNDPIGRIQDAYEGNPRYRFTTLPALNEQGESNFTYLYDLGFSTEYYLDMRQSLVEAGEEDSWSAKYQCAPYHIGGLMFAKDELQYFEQLPEGEPDAVIAVCDTKDRGADYCCMPIGYVYGTKHYITDVVCDNGLPEAVEPRLAATLTRHGAGLVQFESNAAGGRVADSVADRCRELGHSVDIRKKYSTANKETRILTDSAWIKQNCLFRETPPSEDYRRFMAMLTGYSTEGRNKHDDAPDAMSMYKRFVSSAVTAKVQAMRRPC